MAVPTPRQAAYDHFISCCRLPATEASHTTTRGAYRYVLPALTPDEARASLVAACQGGDYQTVRWLTSDFQLTIHDVMADNYLPFSTACGHGHLPVARLLYTRYTLLADAAVWPGTAFGQACRHGHVEVVAWLVGQYSLSPADLDQPDGAGETPVQLARGTPVGPWLAARFADQPAQPRPAYQGPFATARPGGLTLEELLTVLPPNIAGYATPCSAVVPGDVPTEAPIGPDAPADRPGKRARTP